MQNLTTTEQQCEAMYAMPRALLAAQHPHVSGLKYLIRIKTGEAIAFSHWSFAQYPAGEWLTLYSPESRTTGRDVGEMVDVRIDQIVTCGLSAIPLRDSWDSIHSN
jgi:hypothetical protein